MGILNKSGACFFCGGKRKKIAIYIFFFFMNFFFLNQTLIIRLLFALSVSTYSQHTLLS